MTPRVTVRIEVPATQLVLAHLLWDAGATRYAAVHLDAAADFAGPERALFLELVTARPATGEALIALRHALADRPALRALFDCVAAVPARVLFAHPIEELVRLLVRGRAATEGAA